MKLKVKIFLMSLAIITVLGSTLTVIVEYALSADAKNKIEAAKNEEQRKKEQQQALEDEAKYEEQKRIDALNSYDNVEDYYNGRALVKRDGKYGYIDENGKEVISLKYDVANNFTNRNYTKVKKDGKWGYINRDGQEIIPVEYSYCGEVSLGIVAVGNGGKYGFISIDGKEITGLNYDKVEAFDPSNGLAKVILNQKYGMIDENGKEIVAIVNDYVDENLDFSGEWKETDTHSSKAGNVIISGQTATSFNFDISSKYFSKSGNITGTAEIVKSNVAEYSYNNGELADTITFTVIDGELIVNAKNGGNCELDAELSPVGTYTLEAPKYKNENVINKLFGEDKKLLDRIKNALGEEIYSEYFIYGFKNGEYEIEELDDTEIIQGTVYIVKVPTLEKDFKLLISKDNIYFFAKHKETYITDDEARKTRVPSAIAFDEL